MLKLGSQSIPAVRLGGVKIKKAYLGETVVFDTLEPPVSTYTISASIDPAGSGTVSGAGVYQAGETVTITATPGEGYKFAGWQESGVVVSEDAAYSFTVTGDRVLMAVFEIESNSGLPNGYTQLEYLQSGDSGMLDRGPYLSIPATPGASRFKIKVMPTVGISGNYGCYFIGSSTGDTVTSLVRALGFFNGTLYSNAVIIRQGTYNANSGSTYFTGLFEPNQEYVFMVDPSLKSLQINGTVHSYNSGSSTNWAALATNLFKISNLGTLQAYNRSLRIYYVKWYDSNGNVIRNLVPARDSSGILGMFDIVSNTFYKNANTSTHASNIFTAGPAV